MSIAEEITLKDSASSPASKIASALGRVNRELDKLVTTATRVRDFGPDLERALSAADKAKGAGALANKLALEDAKKANKIAATDAAAGAKARLQADKLLAADQMAKNKAIAALILEQAKASGQLAANQNKAAIQTERVAAATAKTANARVVGAKAIPGGSGARPASGGGSDAKADQTSSKLDGIAGTLGVIASVLAVVGGAVAGLTAAFIGASVAAAEFKSNTIGGLKAMLGSKEAAEDMYASIKKFAKESPFGKEEVAAGFKSLLGAGFSKADTEKVLLGLFDVSALNNFDQQVITNLSRALGQIKGKGKLMTEELNQIVEGSGGQVSRKAVFAEIAASMKKPVGEVEKLLSTGKVTAETGIDAIMETIRKNLSGGKLGALSKELGAQSLTGLLSTLKDFFTDMFEGIDIGPLKKALSKLTDVLGGPAGDKLLSAVTYLGNAIFDGLFGGLGDTKQMESIIGGVATAINFVSIAIEAAAPYMKAFGAGIVEGFGDVGKVLKEIFGGKSFDKKPIEAFVEVAKNAGKAIAYIVSGVAAFAVMVGEGFVFLMGIIGAVLGVIGSVVGAIMSAISSIQSFVGSVMGSSGSSLGTSLTDGVVAGIIKGTPAVSQAASTMASAATSAAGGTWQVASPSKVFAHLGLMLPTGAAGGVVRGTPMLARAVGAMANAGIAAGAPLNDNGGAPLAGSARSAAGTGGGPVQINYNAPIHVDGAASPEQAQAIGAAAARGNQAEWEAHLDAYLRKRGERAA